ncbi:MAG: hypothetical protein AAFX87_08640 [Bacteroidota bacterium]
MKKVYLLLTGVITCVFISNSFAQQIPPEKTKKWHLSTIGLNIGGSSHNYPNLTYQGLQTLAKDARVDQVDMSGMVRSPYFAAVMSGGVIGGYVGFSKDISHKWQAEKRFKANVYTFGEVVVEYQNLDNNTYESVGWCLMNNRLELEASYLFRRAGNRSSITMGPSLGAGTSFNDILIFLGSSDRISNNNGFESGEEFKLRSTKFLTASVDFQYAFRLVDKLALTFDTRFGLGRHLTGEREHDFTSTMFSTSVGFEYQFFRN